MSTAVSSLSMGCSVMTSVAISCTSCNKESDADVTLIEAPGRDQHAERDIRYYHDLDGIDGCPLAKGGEARMRAARCWPFPMKHTFRTSSGQV